MCSAYGLHGGPVVERIRLYCGRPGFDPWVGKIPRRRAWQPTPVFLPGESPRTEEPGGLQSIRSQRVGHDWVTKHSTQQMIGFPKGKTKRGLQKRDQYGHLVLYIVLNQMINLTLLVQGGIADRGQNFLSISYINSTLLYSRSLQRRLENLGKDKKMIIHVYPTANQLVSS